MGQKSFTKHLTKLTEHNKDNEQRKAVHLTYKKLNGRTVKRKIDPLVMKGNLVVAWDHKRKALRSFKVERITHMKKVAFWEGFNKKANALHHAAEVAGLGLLAVPTIQKMRGKKISDKAQHRFELGGLGVLAAPAIHALAKGAK